MVHRIFQITISIILMSLFSSIANAQEYRISGETTYEMTKNLKGGFSYEKRLYHSEIIESTADILKIELKYDLTKTMSIGTSYRSKISDENFESPSMVDLNDNQRITVDFGFSLKLKNNLKLKNRIRFHYSFFDDEHPEPYLRERLVLEKKVNSYLSPYLGYELFFDLEDDQLSAKRFYLGNESKISDKINLEAFYIKEQKRDKNRSEFILGLGLIYKIKKATPKEE